MTRRPARAPTRRLALALSVMLLAAALTVPAFADSHATEPVEIISPVDGETVYGDTLYLEASTTITDAQLLDAEEPQRSGSWIAWAVRSPVADGSDGACSGDPNNIAGDTGSDVFAGTKSFEGGVFKAEVDISAVEGETCFVFRVVNNPDARVTVTFNVSDALPGFDEGAGEIAQCDAGGECLLESTDDSGQSFAASVNGNPKDSSEAPSVLGLRIPDGEIADTVATACEARLAPGERLAGSVSHLVPINLDGTIRVVNFVPRDVINDDENRGNFQVCIAPIADEVLGTDDNVGTGPYAAYADQLLDEAGNLHVFNEDANLVGPILLDRCTDDAQTACVESRHRIGASGLEITYRIPAVDPWMM